MVGNKTFVELRPRQLKNIKKILPNYYPKVSYAETKFSIIFLFIFIGLLLTEDGGIEMLILITIIVLIIVSLPLLIIIFRSGVDTIYPIIFIQGLSGLYCNFLVGTKGEYEELKIYFKKRRNFDLDKVELKI